MGGRVREGGRTFWGPIWFSRPPALHLPPYFSQPNWRQQTGPPTIPHPDLLCQAGSQPKRNTTFGRTPASQTRVAANSKSHISIYPNYPYIKPTHFPLTGTPIVIVPHGQDGHGWCIQ